MSATVELMQPELFGHDEPPCPGYDVCTIGMCGCRFLGLGTPFASDVKKGIIYAETPLHRNDDDLLLTHREAITQTGNGDAIMNMIANDTTYVTAGQALIAARSGSSLFQVLNLMGCRAMSESDLISYHDGESAIRAKCEKIVAFWNETAADRHFGRSESITKMAETVNAMFADRFGG